MKCNCEENKNTLISILKNTHLTFTGILNDNLKKRKTIAKAVKLLLKAFILKFKKKIIQDIHQIKIVVNIAKVVQLNNKLG